jgi:hypothetical protein
MALVRGMCHLFVMITSFFTLDGSTCIVRKKYACRRRLTGKDVKRRLMGRGEVLGGVFAGRSEGMARRGQGREGARTLPTVSRE